MRRNKNHQARFVVFASLAFLLCLTAKSQPRTPHKNKFVFDYDKQIGVASLNIGSPGCLVIANASLKPGQLVSLVAVRKPQVNGQAHIVKRLTQKCAAQDAQINESTSHYEIQVTNGNHAALGLAIAIIKSESSVSLHNNLATTDLDRDGQVEYFYECASNEGLHLTVWTGKPLFGKRRWHYYYYLGYDLEPNCSADAMREP